MRGIESGDLSTELLRLLDDFDVTVIPFGYVALFIILYIIVVGPLDFFLLKYVFKRLEWTWITFPVVVLSVSVIAYFAADYALKGRDLKINKVDIVDFDLRTELDGQHAGRGPCMPMAKASTPSSARAFRITRSAWSRIPRSGAPRRTRSGASTC